jgi:hypothetical protein
MVRRTLFCSHCNFIKWVSAANSQVGLVITDLMRALWGVSLMLMLWAESESYITTDGQPASLSWNKAPIWGLRPDLYYLCDSYGLVLVGRPLWREVESVFCMCCWPLPVQSFLGPSPVGLVAIFYCLRFETSLLVASYDSQGQGGGIRPCLHMGELWAFSHVLPL